MLRGVTRWFGLRIVANRVVEIMFGKKFLNDPDRTNLKRDWKERLVTNDRIGITRVVSGAITREGVSDRLNLISVPTLIIAGDQDVAAIPDKAKEIHAGITNSELVIIPGAGHTSPIEEPEAVTAALEEFLNRLEARS